jgi:hypothetical protein
VVEDMAAKYLPIPRSSLPTIATLPVLAAATS